MFRVYKGNVFGIAKANGELIFASEYSEIRLLENGMFRLQKNGLFGLAKADGEIILPCEYTRIVPIEGNRFEVHKNNVMGIVRSNGSFIFACEYTEIRLLDNGIYVLQRNGLFGLARLNGQIIAPCEYTSINPIDRGWFEMRKNGVLSWLDADFRPSLNAPAPQLPAGFELIPIGRYARVRPVKEGMVAVSSIELGNLNESAFWGFVDASDGSLAIPLKYGYVWDFQEGIAGVMGDSLSDFGYIDKTGREIVPLGRYNYHGGFINVPPPGFYNGHAIVWRGDLDDIDDEGIWGIINKNGVEVAPLGRYQEVYHFSEGLAVVGRNNLGFGFIDENGREVIACQFFSASGFSEGLAYVITMDGDAFFIDKAGNKVLVM
jgi:hypothetical protein